MKLLSSTGTRRNTAWGMLLAWMFVLASGVANACLLVSRSTHRDSSPAAPFSATASLSSISAGHAGVVASHNAGLGKSKAACLKACDDGTRSVLKQPSGFHPTEPGMAPFVAVVWTAAAPVVAAPGRVSGRWARAPEPPVRLRYSRLAL